MDKSVRNYMLGSLCAFFIVMFIVIATADNKDASESKDAETVSTTAPRTLPVPAFEETENTLKIPNPCETVSLDESASLVPNYLRQGPVVQNAVAPVKKCEWTSDGIETPRFGVSIALSPTYFDESEAKKLSDLSVGDKAYSVDGYVTGFGGTICGKTAIVKKGVFSFAVALCEKNNKKPSDKELERLAKEVEKSLK